MTSRTRRTTAGVVAALLTALPVTLVPAPAGAVADGARDPKPVAPFVPSAEDPADLREAWARWQALGEDDYVTRVRLTCFCVRMRPIRTVVSDGETVLVERMTDPPRELTGKGFGMDRLFHMIRRWEGKAHQVVVEYDERGVPVSISIDVDPLVIDEERYYDVRLKQK